MTARDFLESARRIDERIGHRIEERNRLKASLDRGTDGVCGEAVRRARADVEAFGEEIAGEISALCSAKRAVMAAIEAVPEERCRLLLELRYRSYMTWDAIAVEMAVQTRQVYRLHARALKAVERQMGAHGTAASGGGEAALI